MFFQSPLISKALHCPSTLRFNSFVIPFKEHSWRSRGPHRAASTTPFSPGHPMSSLHPPTSAHLWVRHPLMSPSTVIPFLPHMFGHKLVQFLSFSKGWIGAGRCHCLLYWLLPAKVCFSLSGCWVEHSAHWLQLFCDTFLRYLFQVGPFSVTQTAFLGQLSLIFICVRRTADNRLF